MFKILVAILVLTVILSIHSKAEQPVASGPGGYILDFKANLADGTEKALSDFKGQVLVLVNVASRCGFTGQYEDLQKLQEKYGSQGFTILAFPSNDFLGQEPGTNAEIVEFCRTSYGVTFPVFAKISVSGDEIHPLYKFLIDEKTNHGYSGKISWNFNKFIIDRKGRVVARFGSITKPMSAEFVGAVEKALSEKAE